jgi:hypothetical protein
MDHYEYLGVSPTATAEDIKAAYLRKRAHLQSSEIDEQQRTEQLQLLDEAFAEATAALAESTEEGGDDSLNSAGESSEHTAIALTDIAGAIAISEPDSPKPQRECIQCGTLNPIQATMCQACGQQIARPCPACGQLISLQESVCPRCDTVIAEYDHQRFVEAEVAHKRVQDERRTSSARVNALEAIHRINARRGLIFWFIVMMLCIGLTLITTFLYNYFSQIYY